VAARLCIGTSGWNYAHWREGFYAGVPRRAWLAHCAGRFTGLEINASFYRLQSHDTYARWRKQTPEDFCFALKANRYLTHSRKLTGAREAVRIERSHARALGPRLAAVLWQLPATFHAHYERLEPFLRALSSWRSVRHAVEFRHPSWFNSTTAALLAGHGVAVCQSDSADWPLWDAVTADMIYVRLHGHTRTYASAYRRSTLERWAQRIGRWNAEGRDVHVYFDNDAEGAAPGNALTLLQLCAAQSAQS